LVSICERAHVGYVNLLIIIYCLFSVPLLEILPDDYEIVNWPDIKIPIKYDLLEVIKCVHKYVHDINNTNNTNNANNANNTNNKNICG